ncbi:hypothetical protein F5Y14DRAFT_232147 [Nemania sp. NC0429]|nr:hypothetical protein F5Y14DRAFT_232147 [Nemania sp. NC0429]
MCGGSRIEWSCGHIDVHLGEPCEKKCGSPQGPITRLDNACVQCDPVKSEKQRERVSELMERFRPQESVDAVQRLTDRGRELTRLMRRQVAEARKIAFGTAASERSPSAPRGESYTVRRGGLKAPRGPREERGRWGPDSEPDSGDEFQLSADMKYVVEKRYKRIDGHLSLISYRREFDEVDPDLLAELREQREKEIAKAKRKEEKRKAKAAGNNNRGSAKPHETLQIGRDTRGEGLGSKNLGQQQAEQGGVKGRSPKQQSNVPQADRGLQPPPLIEPERLVSKRNHVTNAKEAHNRIQKALFASPNSFRARAEQNGLLGPPFEEAPTTSKRSRLQASVVDVADDHDADDADISDNDSAGSYIMVDGGSEIRSAKGKGKSASYYKSPAVEDEDEDLDIWEKIAAEDVEDMDGGVPLRR